MQLTLFLEKKCASCGQTKVTSEFGTSKNRPNGTSSYCKACKSIKSKNLYFKDHAATLSRKAKYNEKNKEAIRAYKTKWRNNNREKHNAGNKRYAREHPDVSNAKYKKYQESKRNAVPIWASQKAMKEFYTMAHAKTRETGIKHHVDHMVPLQSDYVCGLHCEANLRVIPQRENQSKSNLYWPDMW